MRKYQQLLLLIFGIGGVTLMLFYRHEYLKLRAVLSVLNFFGNLNTENSSCLLLSNDLKADAVLKYTLLEPRSAWTKLDDYFIYSSFWEDVAEGGVARTLVVGPKSSLRNYTCRVWFEEGDIIASEAGVFQSDLDLRSKTIRNHKYFFKCSVKSKPLEGVPYGVLWVSSSSRVFSPLTRKRNMKYESVICVRPDYAALAKTDIIEFISYYNAIGVSHFIIYDSGIQHSIFPFLEAVTGSSGILRSIAVLQWNFPVTDSKLELMSLQDDCLSRTFGIARLVGVVAWNEYILPAGNNLSTLIASNKITDLIGVSFDTWVCCTDSADDISAQHAWPTFLRKTRCRSTKRETSVFFNRRPYGNARMRISDVDAESATLRRYDSCGKLAAPTLTTVLSTPEFYTTVASHKLLQLWKSYRNTLAVFT